MTAIDPHSTTEKKRRSMYAKMNLLCVDAKVKPEILNESNYHLSTIRNLSVRAVEAARIMVSKDLPAPEAYAIIVPPKAQAKESKERKVAYEATKNAIDAPMHRPNGVNYLAIGWVV